MSVDISSCSPRAYVGSTGSYAEKVEYWAGMWGTHGVDRFDDLVLCHGFHLDPALVIDVATTIHYYEAILATLTILVWHFYRVIFDPDVLSDELEGNE